MKDAVIIGGGISGLSTAHFLKKLGKDVLLIEKGRRVGGVTQSHRRDGFLIEKGPNTFMGINENMKELIDDVGLSDQVVFSSRGAKNRYVYNRGRLRALPKNPIQFLMSPLFPFASKMAIVKEPFVAKREVRDESVHAFFTRRLGREIAEGLVDPFVSGIYAGDTRRLSVRAAFPKLVEWEQTKGSLIKGALTHKGPKKDRRLFSFPEGLSQLMEAIGTGLGRSLLIQTQVKGLQRKSDGTFVIDLFRDGEAKQIETRSVVMALPAHVAAQQLVSLNDDIAAVLSTLPYAPLIVYHLGFKKRQIRHSLNGFGCLIPRREQLKTLGILWSSSLFTNRAPNGSILLTVMAGGATQPGCVHQDGHAYFHQVFRECRKLLGIQGDPLLFQETAYALGIPQYELGHLEKVSRIKALLEKEPGLFITGNFLEGPSGPQCVDLSHKLAHKLAHQMAGRIAQL